MPDDLRARLSGVVAIPVTPLDDRGDIDEPAYAKVLRRMVDGGIDVLTPGGNTGEFYALTEPETRRLVQLTVATAGDAATVLAGVGHAVPDAIEAARFAQAAGAHAVMIHQPVHPYVSAEGWVEYHRAIAAGVPELGVVLYVRDARIDGTQLARLGELCPNVIGVKYAVPDPVRFAAVASVAGPERFLWLAGLAELSAPGYWPFGAVGFTSGLANVHPALSLELLHALRSGSPVTAVVDAIRPFEALRARNNAEHNVSIVKEALAQLGICGPDVRPPASRPGQSDRDAVSELLSAWGLA